MTGRATHCDVCGRPLSVRGRARTGLCRVCYSDGALFAARWMRDLRTQGLGSSAIAEIVGVAVGAVRARLSDLRRRERTA